MQSAEPAPPATSGAPDVAETPLIEVRDLVVRYSGVTVLDRLNIDILRGETVAIIGGSGAGKSTFGRVLVGLELPTSGHILVDGADLTRLRGRALGRVRRRFAMVFQKHALLDSLTAFDNVAFPLREETDFDEDEIRQRVLAALQELGVEDAWEKLPAQLSGGMAKRVGIARAIVTEPEILVYDEPTSGLDPVTARTVDVIVDRMREQHLVTSIVITHDMVTAYEVADRVVLLADGRIMADGVPEVIFTSQNQEILPFALSSGIDLQRLAPRKGRKPATEIRMRWRASHAAAPLSAPGWAQRWHSFWERSR